MEVLRCPSCGAPVDPKAAACPYCRAVLHPLRCPWCFGWTFAEMRDCQRCGAAAVPEAPDAPKISCPTCRKGLAARTLGRARLAGCGGCGGVWADTESFRSICADRSTQAAYLGEGAVLPSPSISDPSTSPILYRPCPVCAELMNRFKLAPAAKSMHHAYLGGLLEHSVSVAELLMDICGRYPDLDRDLLLVGAILHDMGKTSEFVYDLVIDYSHEGRLLGHMVLGVQILEDKIAGLKKFPSEEALLLKHMILSHHGETDMGAVRLPMTREAFVLHFADDLDAKMNNLTRIISDRKDGDLAWTPYQRIYERFFFRGLPSAREEGPLPEGEPERDRGGQLNLWAEEKKRKGGP